jgi:hypothetical protein
MQVDRIIRVQYGPYMITKGKMNPGQTKEEKLRGPLLNFNWGGWSQKKISKETPEKSPSIKNKITVLKSPV